MEWNAKWIQPETDFGEVVPLFFKNFYTKEDVKNATLTVTAQGVYEAILNGVRVSSYVLAPRLDYLQSQTSVSDLRCYLYAV